MITLINSFGCGHTLLGLTNQVAVDIFSLLESGNPFTSLMFLNMTNGIPNHTHACHSLQATLGVSQSIRQITREPIAISGLGIRV